MPDDWRDWALTNCPLSNAVTVRDQADRFADYWRAQPGVKGRKTDWQATWRNWCRTAFASAPTRKRVGSPMAMIGSINGLSRF